MIEMIEQKVLSCSPNPDSEGDIIPPDSIDIPENGQIQIFKESQHPKNFVTFATAEVKPDGLYVKFPAPALASYSGKFLAPEGSVKELQRVHFQGRRCRLIKRLLLSGISIVPKHVDQTIRPVEINAGKQDSPDSKNGSGEEGSDVAATPGARGSRGVDSSDKSPKKKKKVFKRRSRR